MKNTIKLFVSFLVILPFLSKAQDGDKEKSHFQVGVNYLTNNVYLGRKDSTSLPYITPSFGYYHKSGFHISGSLSYAPSPEASQIDLFTIEAGYDFSVKDKFNGGVYVDKYFFNGTSFAINSEINTGLGAYASYNFGALTANGEVGTSIGTGTDFIASAGLSHKFSALDDHFSIEPGAKFNASGLNFYQAYYKKGRQFNVKKGGRRGGGGSGSGTNTTVQTTGFSIMDYELSVLVTYENSKFKLAFVPTYAIPVSPATVTTGATTGQESLSNTFFASFEVDYKF